MMIDGKAIANDVLVRLRALPKPAGFFGAALVGDDPASINFLKQKERAARELGIEFRLSSARRAIFRPTICGARSGGSRRPRRAAHSSSSFLCRKAINRHYVLNAIPKEKDVDCLGEPALGAFYTGRGKVAPPSVATVEEIIKKELKENLRNIKAVVVGAGFLIGKPVGFWLENRVGEPRGARRFRARRP